MLAIFGLCDGTHSFIIILRSLLQRLPTMAFPATQLSVRGIDILPKVVLQALTCMESEFDKSLLEYLQ